MVLGLILWQMMALKLPAPTWVQYAAILIGNLGAIAWIVVILNRHFLNEEVRTKRAFEPASLIGTMQPAPPSGD